MAIQLELERATTTQLQPPQIEFQKTGSIFKEKKPWPMRALLLVPVLLIGLLGLKMALGFLASHALQNGEQAIINKQDSRATQELKRSVVLFRLIRDSSNLKIAMKELGLQYEYQRLYDKAEEIYTELSALETESGDNKSRAQTLLHLADVRGQQGKWEEALKNYQESLRIHKELHPRDEETLASIQVDIGYSLLELNQIDSALSEWQRVVELAAPNSQPSNQAKEFLAKYDSNRNYSDGKLAPKKRQAALETTFARGIFSSSFAVASAESGRVHRILAVDLNDDGFSDLAVSGASKPLEVLLNGGNGVFVPSGSLAQLKGTGHGLVVGNFNGNSETDFAVAIPGDKSVNLYFDILNSVLVSSYKTGEFPVSLASGNLDNSLPDDIAVADSSSNSLIVMRNIGDGTFTEFSYPSGGEGPQSIQLGDLDGRSGLDIVVCNRKSGSVCVFLNDGNGNFAQSSSGPLELGPLLRGLALGDFDGKGGLDAVVCRESSETVQVLLNDGAGNLTNEPDYIFSVGSQGPISVVCCDFDGDFDLDIATANLNGHSVSVLLNDGTAKFVLDPGSPYPSGEAHDLAVGKFDRTGRPGLAVANLEERNIRIFSGR